MISYCWKWLLQLGLLHYPSPCHLAHLSPTPSHSPIKVVPTSGKTSLKPQARTGALSRASQFPPVHLYGYIHLAYHKSLLT